MARSTTPARLALVRGAADLISYAHSLRFDGADRAVGAARQAVAVAERCDLGGNEGCDLRSRAWGVLGNSLRISGKLRAAGQALEVSERWRLMGSGSGELEVSGLFFRASLAIARRRLPEADSYLTQAEAVVVTDPSRHIQARIKRAIVATYQGKLSEAVTLLRETMAEPEGWTLDLQRSAGEVLMFAYALDGEARKALEAWLVLAVIYEGCGDLMRLKLRWVRGLVSAQLLGRTAELRDLQAEYAARGMAYDAALVSLDLAVYAAQAGDHAAAGRHLDEAEPILRACGVPASTATSLDSLRALRLALAASSTTRDGV